MTDLKMEIYKEAVSINRAIFEGVFKIAGLTFTCNAVLLAALSFVIRGDSSSNFSYLTPWFYMATTIFGIVFNSGIFVFYLRTSKTWLDLHREGVKFEENFLADSEIRIFGTIENTPSRFGATNILTNIFYVFIIFAWFFALFGAPY
jgi:hypothetical protein